MQSVCRCCRLAGPVCTESECVSRCVACLKKKILNEILKHVLVRVYHLQGEHNAHSLKQSATAKLLCIGSLVCNTFVVDIA